MARKLDFAGVGGRMAGRRRFLSAAGMAGIGALGAGMLGHNTARGVGQATYEDPKKHHASTFDILNFALNLEYLEAEYYLRATTGAGLADSEITGVGGSKAGRDAHTQVTPGAVTGGTRVNFASPTVAQLAADIAADEHAHVLLLRSVLGNRAVARPTIDLSASFTAAAVAAGLITQGQTFDPFADDDSFLLGAFVFEDVGVTAYHGAATHIGDGDVLQAAAGLLGTEAYHAGAVRAFLGIRGQTAPSDLSIANGISSLRAHADGSGGNGNDAPLTDSNGALVIAANDANGLVYARTLNQVLSIVYLGGAAGTGGGFFPNAMNGAIQ